MTEIKIIVVASELTEAINKLASAVASTASIKDLGADSKSIWDRISYAAAVGSTDTPDASHVKSSGNTEARAEAPASLVPAAACDTPTAAAGVPVTPMPASVSNTQPVSESAPPAAVPTAAPTYTLEMIAVAGSGLVDAGKMNELCAILAKYGVNALTELDPSMYGQIAMELRALGAQI